MTKGTRLTVRSVRDLKPRSKAYSVKDTTTGLTLVINPTGVKTWYLLKKVGGKTRRVNLGAFPTMGPKGAREALVTALSRLQRVTRDQVTPKHVDATTARLEDVWEHYVDNGLDKLRSAQKYRLLWKNHLSKLGQFKLSELDVPTVGDHLDEVEATAGPAASNRNRSLLTTLWKVALRQGWTRSVCPVLALPRAKENPGRERYLTEAELKRFLPILWAWEDHYVRDSVLLLLFTGARKGNVLQMRWGEINFEDKTWVIPREKFKMDREHTVPLVDTVMDILRSRQNEHGNRGYVFPSARRSGWWRNLHYRGWPDLLDAASLKDFRPHDIRHTMATWAQDSGATEEMVAALLGHKRKGITARYAHVRIQKAREAAEMAEAVFLRWSGEIPAY